MSREGSSHGDWVGSGYGTSGTRSAVCFRMDMVAARARLEVDPHCVAPVARGEHRVVALRAAHLELVVRQVVHLRVVIGGAQHLLSLPQVAVGRRLELSDPLSGVPEWSAGVVPGCEPNLVQINSRTVTCPTERHSCRHSPVANGNNRAKPETTGRKRVQTCGFQTNPHVWTPNGCTRFARFHALQPVAGTERNNQPSCTRRSAH